MARKVSPHRLRKTRLNGWIYAEYPTSGTPFRATSIVRPTFIEADRSSGRDFSLCVSSPSPLSFASLNTRVERVKWQGKSTIKALVCARARVIATRVKPSRDTRFFNFASLLCAHHCSAVCSVGANAIMRYVRCVSQSTCLGLQSQQPSDAIRPRRARWSAVNALNRQFASRS